jgi:hypothetical protein
MSERTDTATRAVAAASIASMKFFEHSSKMLSAVQHTVTKEDRSENARLELDATEKQNEARRLLTALKN